MSSFAMAHREAEREPRALPHRALHPDAAPMQLHELLGQGQPESRALLLTSVVAPDLTELLEDGRLVLGRNANPRVADGDRDHVPARRRGDADPAPFRGEF